MTINDAFGRLIRQARVAKGLSQKDLAAKILREDGEPISAQYLSDIEHGRRLPPGESFVRQLARHLELDVDGLLVAAGRVPDDIRKMSAQDLEGAADIFKTFRKRST